MNDPQRNERQILAMPREFAARVRERNDSLYAGVAAWLPVLEDPGENATRLRSSAPFAGTPTPQDRWRMLRDIQ